MLRIIASLFETASAFWPFWLVLALICVGQSNADTAAKQARYECAMKEAPCQ